MRKILMRDVKSGSGNVKKFFRLNKDQRSGETISKLFKFSNDELIELHDLIMMEGDRSYRVYVSRLIVKQKGPFNEEVVKTYLPRLESGMSDMIFALMTKAENISEKTKYEWLKKAMPLAERSFDAFIKNDAERLGFDLTKEPFRRAVMMNAIASRSKFLIEERLAKVYEYLDKLNEDEMYEFYIETSKGPEQAKQQFRAWSGYPRTTAKIIEHFIRNAFHDEYKVQMVKHKNCPEYLMTKINMEMYEKTGDESFLPEEVQDIFVF